MLTCFWDHGIKAPRRLEQGNTWFACDAFYTSSCLVWITVKVLKCAKDLNRSGGCLQVLCFVTIPEDFCVLNGKFRDAKAKGCQAAPCIVSPVVCATPGRRAWRSMPAPNLSGAWDLQSDGAWRLWAVANQPDGVCAQVCLEIVDNNRSLSTCLQPSSHFYCLEAEAYWCNCIGILQARTAHSWEPGVWRGFVAWHNCQSCHSSVVEFLGQTQTSSPFIRLKILLHFIKQNLWALSFLCV